MNNARQCEIESWKRTYFVLAGSIGNQIRKKEDNTPCQCVKYRIKILVSNYFHHSVTREAITRHPSQIYSF